MKLLEITPGKLRGDVWIQPSKSLSHRGLICAALAEGTSILKNVGASQDLIATGRGLEALGLARILGEPPVLAVSGGLREKEKAMVDCKESGSTLRFLLPVALACGVETLFTGGGRLFQRPMAPYLEALRRGGATIEEKPEGILAKGRLQSGAYVLPGNVSSQYVSGLLLALPLLKESSQIAIEGELQSADYVALTQDVQALFGIVILREGNHFTIKPGKYTPFAYHVEADWSHAAFYLTAGFLGNPVSCRGLYGNSLQGDRAVTALLTQMGARIWDTALEVKALPGTPQASIIDAAQVPDLVPALAVAACGVTGETRIIHAERLRLKESDRLAAIAAGITALGGSVAETSDGLLIYGSGSLRGGRVSAWGDHRIAMSLAIAATICREPVLLEGYETVEKSAPDFWREYESLGGVIHEHLSW